MVIKYDLTHSGIRLITIIVNQAINISYSSSPIEF